MKRRREVRCRPLPVETAYLMPPPHRVSRLLTPRDASILKIQGVRLKLTLRRRRRAISDIGARRFRRGTRSAGRRRDADALL